MSAHQTRSAVLAFATLVVASIALGAPIPLLARPPTAIRRSLTTSFGRTRRFTERIRQLRRVRRRRNLGTMWSIPSRPYILNDDHCSPCVEFISRWAMSARPRANQKGLLGLLLSF
jgi:hypothetical protein